MKKTADTQKKTTKRIIAAQLRVGQVARAWSLGENGGRGIKSKLSRKQGSE